MLLQNDVFVFSKEYFHPFNPTPLKYKPLIVVGPSGVGKATLIRAILAKYGDLFEKKKSHTTRAKRVNEEKLSTFYFINDEEFTKMEKSKDLIESRRRLGGKYGTSYKELKRIEEEGKIPIIEVDVQGAIEINKKAIEGNFLFIYPPSFEELRKRIGNREETEAEFKVRISDAIKQIELANNSVLFTNRLVNDTLELAIDQFFTLVDALYF
jgi:guanylate kinase